MKKCVFTLFLLVSFTFLAPADDIERLLEKDVTSMSVAEREKRVEILEERVQEIKAMKLRTLERSEKRDVKNELRYIKKELRTLDSGGGVYLSVGAVIIIVILLLILL